MTRFPVRASIVKGMKFITNTVQKLTPVVVRREGGKKRFVLSNFNLLNEAVLGYCGLFPRLQSNGLSAKRTLERSVTRSRKVEPGNCQNISLQKNSAEAAVRVK